MTSPSEKRPAPVGGGGFQRATPRLSQKAAAVKFRPGAYRDRLAEYLRATGREPDAAGNIRCPSGEHADQKPSCHVFSDGVHCFVCAFHADVYSLAALDLGLPDCRGANWERVSSHIEKVLALPITARAKMHFSKNAVFLATVRERETELERGILALTSAINAGDEIAIKQRDEMLTRLLAWYNVDLVCQAVRGTA